MTMLGSVIGNSVNLTKKDFIDTLNQGLYKIKADYHPHIDYDDDTN